jgi:hypothetical protein
MRKYLYALLAAFVLVAAAYALNTSNSPTSAAPGRCFKAQAGSACINTQ